MPNDYIPRAAALRDDLPEERTCNKIPFDTAEDARREINGIRANEHRFGSHRKSSKKLKVYRCPHCGKYHMTTQKAVRYLRRVRKVQNGHT